MRFMYTIAVIAGILALVNAARVQTLQKADSTIFQDGTGNSADTLVDISKVQASLNAAGTLVDAAGVVPGVVETVGGLLG